MVYVKLDGLDCAHHVMKDNDRPSIKIWRGRLTLSGTMVLQRKFCMHWISK
jgi:hypothetical protein